MRAVLIVLLTAVLVVLLARHVGMRRDHTVSIVLVAVLVSVLALLEYRWAASVHQLTRAVREVAPETSVTCQRFIGTFGYAGAEWGHVDFDEAGRASDSAFLAYDTCAKLLDYLRSDKGAPPIEQVMAVHTLTHEGVHMVGIRAEGPTECAALQRDRAVARALGATPAQADTLSRQYVVSVFPILSAEYKAPDCRPDGALDETPGDGAWP